MDMDSNNEKNERNELEDRNDEETMGKETEQKGSPVFHYAGFWLRFWAYLLDLVVVFSLNGVVLSPLLFSGSGTVTILSFFTMQGILSAVTAYLYFLFMTKWRGQTLGKMVFGLKVIRKDTMPLRWSDLVFREVVGRFMYRSLVLTNIMYIVVGFTDQKQGIHDAIADTRVIHGEK
ncbi:RDD family protein [Salibacterium aidingense]|uniref:RDD family protein n=1 Tax=Salibacterium aidingense TaxID=384933 RepID=UPI003BC10082